MKILLRGGGLINKGAEAMLLTVKAEMAKRVPNAHFILPKDCIHSDAEDTQARRFGFEVRRPRVATRFRTATTTLKVAIRASKSARTLWRRRDEYFPTLEMLAEVDAVLDVHGYAFGDPWLPHYVVRTSGFVSLCRMLRKPYIFLPQSWGPFQRKSTQSGYRGICRDSTAFYARDRASRAYLAELLAQPESEIRLSPDIAFVFNHNDYAVGDVPPLPAILMTTSDPLVGISPNMRVYERAGGGGVGNEYIKALACICRQCIRLGARLVLIPHEIRAPNRQAGVSDDCFLIHLLTGIVDDQSIIALTDQYTAPQIRMVMERLDLLVGSRFHALVGALSAKVPVVALGWSHKYLELLTDVGLNGFCASYSEAAHQEVIGILERAWFSRAELRQRLAACVPGIQGRVGRMFDDVAREITVGE